MTDKCQKRQTPCQDQKICNPLTGRCISKNGAIAQRLMASGKIPKGTMAPRVAFSSAPLTNKENDELIEILDEYEYDTETWWHKFRSYPDKVRRILATPSNKRQLYKNAKREILKATNLTAQQLTNAEIDQWRRIRNNYDILMDSREFLGLNAAGVRKFLAAPRHVQESFMERKQDNDDVW
jgi:hypothetical protein